MDISGKTLSSVVSTIRAYPEAYGSTTYSQWGVSSKDGTDKLQLGNAIFPTGSTLFYQTNTTLETSIAYDVRTTNEIFAYSGAVSGGGDARTSSTQACNSAEAVGSPTIRVTTLEQMTEAFKGTPCIFSQGTLIISFLLVIAWVAIMPMEYHAFGYSFFGIAPIITAIYKKKFIKK